MQTRDMERTNSMSRGKRSLEGEEGQQQQQQPKRPALRRSVRASSSSNADLSIEQRMKIAEVERSQIELEFEFKLGKKINQIELMKVLHQVPERPTKGISIKEANVPNKVLSPKLPVNKGKGKAQITSQKGKKSTGKPTASSIHNPKPAAKQPSRKERTPNHQAVLDSSLSNQPLVQPSQKQTSQKERTPNHQTVVDSSLSNLPLVQVQPSQKQTSQTERTPNHQAVVDSSLSNQPLVQPSQKQNCQKERTPNHQAVRDSSLSNQPLVQVQPSQNQASQKERTLIQGLLDLLSNQSHVQRPSQPGVELSPETPNTSQHIKFIDRPRYFLNASNRKNWRLNKKSKVLAEHHEMLTETWNHIRAGSQDPNPVRCLEKAFTQVFELIQGIQNALKKQGEGPCQSCCQPEPEPEPEVARPTSTGNH